MIYQSTINSEHCVCFMFLTLAFCTCYAGLHDVIIDSTWNTHRNCPKENLILNIFHDDYYCKFVRHLKIGYSEL